MKLIKKIAIIIGFVFVGIQFIPTKHNQSNFVPLTDFMNVYKMSEQLENKIKVACYDCHSNNTNYDWYHNIQPIGWLLENHIEEGKDELDFSIYGTYSKRRQRNKLKSMISQIRNDEMPMWSYTLIHNDAKLSVADKEMLIDWFVQLRESI